MARITKDDFNYGAALKQVADDRRFKSINAEWENGSESRCAFRCINTGIGLYIKMGKEPKTKFRHYIFNFKKENLEEIRSPECEMHRRHIHRTGLFEAPSDLCGHGRLSGARYRETG